jgi:hypothetical protein
MGFFEDREVNRINESIMRKSLDATGCSGPGHPRRPTDGQLWLESIPVDRRIEADAIDDASIASMLDRRPFCLKDPRFCYTLKPWRKHAPKAKIICVFRHPSAVATSIIHEVASANYLKNLTITYQHCLALWRLMYEHVLHNHVDDGAWLFLPYEDLFTDRGLDRVAAFSGTAIDRAFPQKRLNRSKLEEGTLDRSTDRVWRKLVAMGA